MSQPSITNQKLWRFGLILLAWTFYGFFFASQNYIRQVYSNGNADWQRDLTVWLLCGYSWALLTPAILFLVRRFPFTREKWLSSLAVHIPGSIVLSLVTLAVYIGLRLLVTGKLLPYGELVAEQIHSSILVYFATLGVYYGLSYMARPSHGDDARPAVRHETEEPKYAERFTVRGNGRILVIDVDEIDRITSEGNYVKLHANGKSHLLRETMKAMEQALDPSCFLRVRRSAIVRIDHIMELRPLSNGEFEIVLKNGSKVLSSRRYRRNLDLLLKR